MAALLGRIGVALAAAIALLPSSQALGAITIGSDLGRAPTATLCGGECTVSQMALSSYAAGGVLSPVTGTITQWRIRTGPATSPTALRVITRSGVPDFVTALSTSGIVTPPPNTIATYATNLPIRAHDYLGINCCASGSGDYFVNNTGVTGTFGTLVDGETAEPDIVNPWELAVNADVEPSSAWSLRGAIPVGGGAVRIVLNASNPGTISVRGKGPRVRLAAAAKKKRRVRYLRPTTFPVGFQGERVVQPTNAALRVLHHLKRPRVRVSVIFTPLGGVPSAPQFDSVRLSRCPSCPPDVRGRG